MPIQMHSRDRSIGLGRSLSAQAKWIGSKSVQQFSNLHESFLLIPTFPRSRIELAEAYCILHHIFYTRFSTTLRLATIDIHTAVPHLFKLVRAADRIMDQAVASTSLVYIASYAPNGSFASGSVVSHLPPTTLYWTLNNCNNASHNNIFERRATLPSSICFPLWTEQPEPYLPIVYVDHSLPSLYRS